MLGRLFSAKRDSDLIDRVLDSFEVHTPKPYLKPVSSFFPQLKSAQITEIPAGGLCERLACSLCGRYIAAGNRFDVVVADASTGDVLKRLHGSNATCAKFAGGSEKIVYASEDGTVAVWEWEASKLPSFLLEGHRTCVTSVAVFRNGERIVSASDDGSALVWHGVYGLQIEDFTQCTAVSCVAVCADNRTLVIGLRNGTLKVLDCCTGETIFEDEKVHRSSELSVAFSPEGRLLATCEFKDKTFRCNCLFLLLR